MLDDGDFASGGGVLVLALAGDPGVEGGEFAAEWRYFADVAAFFVAVFVKAVEAFFFDEGFKGGCVGGEDFDGDAVMLADLVDELVGFGVETACVEAEYVEVGVDFVGHVDEDHVFGSAEGDVEVIEQAEGAFEDFLGALLVEFGL